MPHWKSMFDDSDMLFAHDLQGRDVTVEIEKVYKGELTGEKGRKTKKPFVKIKGRDKKLALNKTNGRTVAKLYGTDTAAWVGKLITLFPTTTEFGGETVDCIRIRPTVPQRKGQATAAPAHADGEATSGQLDKWPETVSVEPDQAELEEIARRDREGSS